MRGLAGRIGGAVSLVLGGLNQALVWYARPFGVHIKDRYQRFALMQGIFLVIYVVGALPYPVVPLVALALGYIGVLAIGRAWVLNEKQRTAIAKKVLDGKPDDLPDLRMAALVSALQLLVLCPLIFSQVQEHFGWYRLVQDDTTHANASLLDWFRFTLDKTYLKALPDWSILYGVHITWIGFDSIWGKHLVLFTRLTFDFILIQGALRLLAIRHTIREAVAALKADPDMAVRIGQRAVPALIEKLNDPDDKVRGAAASALLQIGDPRAAEAISAAMKRDAASRPAKGKK
jgi:hypothetical protein